MKKAQKQNQSGDVVLVAHRARPLVSVICSVKNGARTIGLVLDSIQRQTLREWEFVIVDDGSVDDSVRIVRERKGKDSRIRLIPTDGVGRGRALNLALEHAQGEFIANIDADDACHPMRLEIQYRVLKDNAQYAVLGTDTMLFFDNEEPRWVDVVPTLENDVPVNDVTKLLTRLSPVNHSSVLMKRSALEKVGGYDERRTAQYDYDLWVRLAGVGYRIGRIRLPLAGKRIHEGQHFERHRRLKYLGGSTNVQYRAIRLLGGGPIEYFYLLARPVWGLLPNRLRMSLRRTLGGSTRL